MKTHETVMMGLIWCRTKDLTFKRVQIKDGRCPYCGKLVVL